MPAMQEEDEYTGQLISVLSIFFFFFLLEDTKDFVKKPTGCGIWLHLVLCYKLVFKKQHPLDLNPMAGFLIVHNHCATTVINDCLHFSIILVLIV